MCWGLPYIFVFTPTVKRMTRPACWPRAGGSVLFRSRPSSISGWQAATDGWPGSAEIIAEESRTNTPLLDVGPTGKPKPSPLTRSRGLLRPVIRRRFTGTIAAADRHTEPIRGVEPFENRSLDAKTVSRFRLISSAAERPRQLPTGHRSHTGIGRWLGKREAKLHGPRLTW